MNVINKSVTANTTFDVIVIGVGSMGSSACFFLASRGYKVLGIEQFAITHDRGSHSGQSRIIRKAYFEHPDYVPLLNRAYENWKFLEELTNRQVFYPTGLVYLGKQNDLSIKGVKESASLYNISIDTLDLSSAQERFPQFKLPTGFEAVFEPDAGFITPEKAISIYTEQAMKRGAVIQVDEKVLEWEKDGDTFIVTTDKETYRCSKLLITSGAWTNKMVPALAQSIKVTRQFVAWVKPKKQTDFSLDKFPCWMIADDEMPGMFYGFPVLPVATFGEPGGLKLAYHYPGQETDPDKVDRIITKEEERILKYALEKYLPGCFESIHSTQTCLYSNTNDENFIIDFLPGYEKQVAIACGFSGHGFKFVSVVGEILAELILDGKTKQPINFLNAKRFL